MWLDELPSMGVEMLLLLDHNLTCSLAQWWQYHNGLVELLGRYEKDIRTLGHTHSWAINNIVGRRIMVHG